MVKITQTNGYVLEFEGELVAEVSSRTDGSDRWTELALYRAVSGKYVAVVIGGTVFDHEVERVRAEVVNELDGIVAVFKFSSLAKRLYAEVGFIPTMRF